MHYELTEGNEKGAGAKLRQAQTAADAAGVVSRLRTARRRCRRGRQTRPNGYGYVWGVPGASRAAMGAGRHPWPQANAPASAAPYPAACKLTLVK